MRIRCSRSAHRKVPITAGVDWSYYNDPKFEEVEHAYLPRQGEGDTMATQMITAVSKLVYRWYNDGDVYDNTYYLESWGEDMSSYANWLYKYVPETQNILKQIYKCSSRDKYERILQGLADLTHSPDLLTTYADQPKVGSIYDCDGPFECSEYMDEEDEYDEFDEDEWY